MQYIAFSLYKVYVYIHIVGVKHSTKVDLYIYTTILMNSIDIYTGTYAKLNSFFFLFAFFASIFSLYVLVSFCLNSIHALCHDSCWLQLFSHTIVAIFCFVLVHNNIYIYTPYLDAAYIFSEWLYGCICCVLTYNFLTFKKHNKNTCFLVWKDFWMVPFNFIIISMHEKEDFHQSKYTASTKIENWL